MVERYSEEASGWDSDDIQNAIYAVLDDAYVGESEIFHRIINRYNVLVRIRSQRTALAALCDEGLVERGKTKGRSTRARGIYRRVTP